MLPALRRFTFFLSRQFPTYLNGVFVLVLQNMSAGSAAFQAEMIEKEKALLEQQAKLQQMKNTLQTVANRQVLIEREKKRAQITLAELSGLHASRSVYKAVGRVFVKSGVETLVADNKTREEQFVTEGERLSGEKMRLGAVVQKEEAHLQAQIGEFMNQMRMLTIAEGPKKA